jgi:hypothetical protein
MCSKDQAKLAVKYQQITRQKPRQSCSKCAAMITAKLQQRSLQNSRQSAKIVAAILAVMLPEKLAKKVAEILAAKSRQKSPKNFRLKSRKCRGKGRSNLTAKFNGKPECRLPRNLPRLFLKFCRLFFAANLVAK